MVARGYTSSPAVGFGGETRTARVAPIVGVGVADSGSLLFRPFGWLFVQRRLSLPEGYGVKDIEKGSLDPETKTLVAQFLAANAPDIRIGDVWKSLRGGRLVTVVPKSEYRGHGTLTDARDVVFRGVTGTAMVALAANFIRGRVLHERGGIRVGDVRAMGKASTIKVLVLRGDVVVCDDVGGVREYEAPYIAELALISRDGTNAKSESAKGQAETT